MPHSDPENRKRYQKQYYIQHCVKKKNNRKDNYKRNIKSVSWRWKDFLRNAFNRKKTVNITEDFYRALISQSCTYCHEQGEDGYVGIDREDNKIGYTEENSKPCCQQCNYMKFRYTREAFLEKCKKIARVNT